MFKQLVWLQVSRSANQAVVLKTPAQTLDDVH